MDGCRCKTKAGSARGGGEAVLDGQGPFGGLRRACGTRMGVRTRAATWISAAAFACLAIVSRAEPASAQGTAIGAAGEAAAVPGNGQDKHLEAMALLRARDASGAVVKLSACVAIDDPICMNDLAWMLQHGIGMPASMEPARILYRKAANAGIARAMNQLAWMTERGLGGRKDPDGAFALYKAAAERGFGPAIRNMAECHRSGIGVRPDREQALRWDRIADAKDESAAPSGSTRESPGGALASALVEGGFRAQAAAGAEILSEPASQPAKASVQTPSEPRPATPPKEPSGGNTGATGAGRAAAFWRGAVEGAEKIEAREPNAPSAQEVASLAEKAVETDPSVAAHWHMLGYAHAKLVGGADGLGKAEADLGRALAISPDLWQVRLLLADVLKALGRNVEAEAALSRAEASGEDGVKGADALRAKWTGGRK